MIQNYGKQNKPKGILKGKKQEIVEHLFRNGPSYANKIAETIGSNVTVISENLGMLKKRYPTLLVSRRRRKPESEIKVKDEVLYHEIANRELAQALLAEFNAIKKTRPKKIRRAYLFYRFYLSLFPAMNSSSIWRACQSGNCLAGNFMK